MKPTQNDGEAITINPSNGLMYHWSGLSSQIMESINLTTNEVANIPMSGASHGEILSATWDAANARFLVANSSQLFTATTTGVFAGLPPIGVSINQRARLFWWNVVRC